MASGVFYLVLILFAALALRYYLIPLLLESFLRVNIHSVSPLSVRGIQWVSSRPRKYSPKVKIGRIGLQRSKRSGGLLTIAISQLNVWISKTDGDVSLEQEHEKFEAGDGSQSRTPKLDTSSRSVSTFYLFAFHQPSDRKGY